MVLVGLAVASENVSFEKDIFVENRAPTKTKKKASIKKYKLTNRSQ